MYVVSTKDQSVDMQLNDLERYTRERGFKVFKVYKDNGVSGTKETRPALSELMNDAKKRKFDIVLGLAISTGLPVAQNTL